MSPPKRRYPKRTRRQRIRVCRELAEAMAKSGAEPLGGRNPITITWEDAQ